MNTIRSIVSASIITIASVAASSAFAQTVKATVNGMVCSFCAQGIEKRLTSLEATDKVFVDLKGRLVAVAPKSGKSFDLKVVEKEIKEAGYDVVKIETTSQSIDEIRSAQKAAK